MRILSKILLVVVTIFWFGCSGHTNLPEEKPVIVTDKDEIKLVVGYRGFSKKAHRLEMLEKMYSLQKQEERELWWSAFLKKAGITIGILGLLLVLPVIVKWFSWIPPWFAGPAGFLVGVLTWVASRTNSKIGNVVGSAVTRWGVWLLFTAALCIVASIYIDPIFKYLYFTMLLLGGFFAMGFTWECAAIYYTGSFDVPGDGVKPGSK